MSKSKKTHHHKDDKQVLETRGYKLYEKLGEGSYGTVYRANYNVKGTNRQIALACKVINEDKAPVDYINKFFPREMEIMRKLNHPNLIKIHSIIQRSNMYYVFMQYAEKGDLLDFIRANGTLTEQQAKVWISQVIQGVGHMHGINMCHRDLKCENLLIDNSYHIKISDFGFAKEWKLGDKKSETFCGSVNYSPPEILRGIPYEPLKVDLWGIGVILYVMICKGMPFDSTSLKKMHEDQMSRNWKIRENVLAIISQKLKDFLNLLLEPVPSKRLTTGKMWRHEWIQSSEMIERPKRVIRRSE